MTKEAAEKKKGQRKKAAPSLSPPLQTMKTPKVAAGEAMMTSTIAAVARVAGHPLQQTWVQRECPTETTSCDA